MDLLAAAAAGLRLRRGARCIVPECARPWHRSLALLVALAAVLPGCPGPPGNPIADAALDHYEASPTAFLEGVEPVATCAISQDDPAYEPLETRCDGIDNDCDGQTDVLLPLAPNACDTGAMGACATGWAACGANNTRACVAHGALPEVADGVDNDCNGAVDDVAAAEAVRPRVLVLPPASEWTGDAPSDAVRNTVSRLDQWGLPYDLSPSSTSWDAALADAGNYALVVVPGALTAADLSAARRTALEQFVTAGGVLIVTVSSELDLDPAVAGLAGLASATSREDATQIVFDGPAAIATASLDSPEERALVLTADVVQDSVAVAALAPDPALSGAVVELAHAFAGSTNAGAVLTRRALGRGAVYAFGHDLDTFAGSRCYINCYNPARDVLGLIYRDALREAAHGHVVLKHTVPGARDSVVLLTHDVDAPDAQNSGPWGVPGAEQMATVERQHGARGTFLVTTDYVVGYYNPDLVRTLCADGMCPLGAHSVRHAPDIGAIAFGTGQESPGNYDAVGHATISGEVRVSQQMLQNVTGQLPRAWRSPYLTVNPRLFEALAANGYVADSSYAIGDLGLNLPFSTRTIGINQEVFRHAPLIEFAIPCEDGLGSTDSYGIERRVELQRGNLRTFLTTWAYTMLRNAANGAYTVVLIHPSYGIGVGPTNVAMKMAAADRILRAAEVAELRTDLLMEQAADFWLARDATALDARYDSANGGYQGSIVVGGTPITNLTLEFGDVIRQFEGSPECGTATVARRRVVLSSTLPAGARCEFRASP